MAVKKSPASVTTSTIATYQDFAAQAVSPGNPATGFLRFFPKVSDGKFYARDSVGGEVALGAGGGGGGTGITIDYKIANFTAASNYIYLINTVSAPVTVQAPNGVDGANFEVTDAGGSARSNFITVNPAAGQRFKGLALNEPFIIDQNDINVRFIYNSTLGYWVDDAPVAAVATAQGAAISEWKSFTPTGTWTTNTTYRGKYRQVGDSIEVLVDLDFAGAPNAGFLTISAPQLLSTLGLTLDLSKFPNASDVRLAVGTWTAIDSGVNGAYGGPVSFGGALEFIVVQGAAVAPTNPITFGAGDNLSFRVTLPITEWYTGVVSIGPGSMPIYANNSSVTTATDTTSFAYGEDGALVQAFIPSGTNDVTKYVRCPYSNPRYVDLQVKFANRNWVSLGATRFAVSMNDAGSTYYGIEVAPLSGSSVDFQVIFYSAPYPGRTWATENSAGTRWRVVFSDVPSSVGINPASTTESGIVTPVTQTFGGDKNFAGKLSLGTTTPLHNFHNASTTAALGQVSAAVGGTSRLLNLMQATMMTAGVATDIFLFRDALGTVLGSNLVCGQFDINIVDQATGANAFTGRYTLVTTGNATSDINFSSVLTVGRGTNPINTITVAADGGTGAVKLRGQTIATAPGNAFCHVAFTGMVR